MDLSIRSGDDKTSTK